MAVDLPPAPASDAEPHAHAVGGTAELETPPPGLERVRRMEPTQRQLSLGDEFDEVAFENALRSTAAEERPKVPFGKQVANYVDSINPAKIEGPKLPLIVTCLGAFVAGWDVAALAITGPNIQADFGLSITSLTTLTSYVATAALIFGFPLGYLIDRVKRVNIIRTTETAGAIGDVVQATAGSFGILTIGRGLGSIARVPEQGAGYPLLSDAYPSHARARVFACLAFFGTLGSVVASPVVGFIVKYYGWRQASFVLAIISTLTVLLAFRVKEPKRGAMDRREMGVAEEFVENEAKPPAFSEAIRGAWGIKTLRLVSIAGFVSGFTTILVVIQANIQSSTFGLDPLQRSFLLTLTNILTLPALALGAGIAERLLQKRPSTLVVGLAAVSFINAACYVGSAFAPNLFLFTVLSILPTLALAVVIPATFVVLSLVIPARYRGVGLKVSTPFTLAATLIGPRLVAAIGTGGDLQHVYLYFAPFSVLAGLFYLAASNGVATDIRAARAAALANEESERSRRDRQNKILVCRDIDVSIDEVQILHRVDLDVREGEVVALVGTNGAGKSTLLRAICGLQQASNGAIFFDGVDVTYAATHQNARNGIVYMPGGQGVFPLMTVRDNLLSAGWMNRKDTVAAEAEVERVLEFFPRLRERLDVQAGGMSGGEQQMLALGQAFLMKPKLLMIDELSLGLAPAVVEQLLILIRGMKDEGITVMLVEQSINVALTVADRAVFMDKGEVRFDGPTEELLARPDLVRSVFMGGTGSGATTASRRRLVPSEEEAETLLACEGLTVAFGGVKALTDVDITVGAGEVVGIIGPNGAGKTTLFDLLSGYVTPSSGTVGLAGADVTRMGPDARARLGLGRAFQNAKLFPPLTVRENIAVALEKRASKSPVLAAVWAPSVRASERKLNSRVDGFIELLGLGAYADKFVRELSTGTRRAVEVACQMAAEPKVLLLDEPSSGLAQAETEALGPALLRIVKETGCGMLVIEHDLPLITSISDRLIAMELGKVVTTGTPDEVTHDPRVLASYLATSNDVLERSGSRVASVLKSLSS